MQRAEAQSTLKCAQQPAFLPHPDANQKWNSKFWQIKESRGKCGFTCPDHHYLDNHGVCRMCHFSCSQCTGPSTFDCTQCAWATPHRLGWVQQYSSVASVFQCVADCPKGTAEEVVDALHAITSCDGTAITVSHCAACHETVWREPKLKEASYHATQVPFTSRLAPKAVFL